MKQEFRVVEIDASGSEFERHQGTYSHCVLIYRELIRAGYRAKIKPVQRPDLSHRSPIPAD